MNTKNPNPDFTKIFTSLKKAKRVFRRERLKIRELIGVADEVVTARKGGCYVDVFLCERTRTQCFKAICRFMRYHVFTRRCAKPSHAQFGFNCISCKIHDGLIINLLSESGFKGDKGALWILDLSRLYTNRDQPLFKSPKRHAIFIGVKAFLSK